MWRRGGLEDLVQDVRYGLRQLRKAPGFTIVAILTLALGIGANTAIFTLVHGVLLKSLPVASPGQLYSLGDNVYCCGTVGIQESFTLYSYPLYTHVREHTPEFSEIAAFQALLQKLSIRRTGSNDAAQALNGELVSGNYFSMLGVDAIAGRSLTPDDDQPNARPVAMISYRIWSQNFGLAPSLIGSTLIINQQPTTVIGVAPPGFFGETLRSDPPDVWVPLAMEPTLTPDDSLLHRPDVYWLYAIGRLRPGRGIVNIQAKVTTLVQGWLSSQTELSESNRQQVAKLRVILTPAGAGIAGIQRDFGTGLVLLSTVSFVVLLIACANVANLLLARGMTARVQMALRVALGASRGRLIRQMLTEGVLLALLGGISGVLFAFAAARSILLVAFHGSSYVPVDASPSLPVLGFAFMLSVLTGISFSVVPAWISSHAQPADSLRGTGRSVGGASSVPQRSLLVLQAALSLPLLVGAGLLTQSLRNLEYQQFGFQTPGRVIINLNPALNGYAPERLPWLYQKLQEKLPQIPGVLTASLSLHTPMDDWDWRMFISIEGRAPAVDPAVQDRAFWDRVSAHYFETMGTPLLRGRVIDEHDTPDAQHVAVINETFAHRFFSQEDPIGKRFGMGDTSHSRDFEIVGIVADAKYRDEKGVADPMFFLPLLQTAHFKEANIAALQTKSTYIASAQLQLSSIPSNLQSAVQGTLAEIDQNLTVLKVTSLSDQVSLRFNRPRLIARLSTLYGLLALVLVSVGLYGVVAYMVARRTSEIGVRMALGADRVNIVRMVLQHAFSPIGWGLVIGIPLALAGGRAIASQLYGVRSHDPVVLLTATFALVTVAILAGIVPTLSAASVDPIRSLRNE